MRGSSCMIHKHVSPTGRSVQPGGTPEMHFAKWLEMLRKCYEKRSQDLIFLIQEAQNQDGQT